MGCEERFEAQKEEEVGELENSESYFFFSTFVILDQDRSIPLTLRLSSRSVKLSDGA